MQITVFILILAHALFAYASEVVVLDSKNFEHLTQASTGATTGDWLIKFYAPWCGHCKKLEPIYDKVASALAGEVNVAKVDVTANRELGTRFEIKGFPTLKFFSKGKVYTFKGPRTEEKLIEFARGGYQIQSAEEVRPPMGVLGEISYIYGQAYKQASSDLRAGKFFTINIFLTFLPLLFVGLLLLLVFAPAPAGPPRRRRPAPAEQQTTSTNAAAEAVDGDVDSDAAVNKND